MAPTRAAGAPRSLAILLACAALALAACDSAPAGSPLDATTLGDFGDDGDSDIGVVVPDAISDAEADADVDDASDAGADADAIEDADAERDAGLDSTEDADASDALGDGPGDASTDAAADLSDIRRDSDRDPGLDLDLDGNRDADSVGDASGPDVPADATDSGLADARDAGADADAGDDAGAGFDLFGRDLFDGPPYLVARPNAITFPTAGLLETRLQELVIENDSRRTVRLVQVQIGSLPSQAFSVLSPVVMPYDMAPGEVLTFQVRFRPTVDAGGASTPYANTVRIVSVDPDGGLLTIPLSGTLVGTPERCLDFETAALAMGFGSADAPARRTVALANCGDEPVDLEGLTIAGEDGFRAVPSASLPRTLAPGASFDIGVAYAPSSPERRSAYLLAEGDGAIAALSLTGGVECPEPVIRIGDRPSSVSAANVEVLAPVTLSAADSVDEAGGPLSYAWTIIPPAGSAGLSVTPDLESETLTFTPDVAGAYFVNLAVRSETSGLDGCFSDGATLTAASSVSVSYRFELSWDTSDDVDIHLLRSGTTGSFAGAEGGPNDCHWANESPDWGVAGASDDDPEFLGDVQMGPGTETITLPSLEEGRSYRLTAFFFTARELPPSELSLAVFEDDVLVGRFAVDAFVQGTYYDIVDIDADGITDLTD